MTITDAKELPASERFMLVRIEPARYIEPALISGSTYGLNFPYPISRVTRFDGSSVINLDLVNDPPTNNDEFSHDESTGQFKVKLASAPNDTNNILILYYHLFYTADISRIAPADPMDNATTEREWMPKIIKYPNIAQSFSNLINGVFTINSSSIVIDNSDYEFQNYLTADDSFANKDVRIWLCINGIENIKPIYQGSILDLRITKSTVTMQVSEPFNPLAQTAYLLEEPVNLYFSNETFPNIQKESIGQPFKMLIGRSTPFQTVLAPTYTPPVGIPNLWRVSSAERAININYDPTPSYTNNREFVLCRIYGGSLYANQTIGSLTSHLSVSVGGGNVTLVKFSSFGNVEVGDYIRFNVGAFFDERRLVLYNQPFTYLGNPYDCVLDGGGSLTGKTPVAENSIAVIMRRNGYTSGFIDDVYHFDPGQYTLSLPSLGVNSDYVKITLNNSAESSTGAPFDPNSDILEVRYSRHNDFVITDLHGDQVRKILDSCRPSSTSQPIFTVNTASTSAANAALPLKVSTMIPSSTESDYGTYLDYLTKILKSTQGYLKINDDFEIEYHLMDAPSSANERSHDLILNDSLNISVQYQDISPNVILQNPDFDPAYLRDISDGPYQEMSDKKLELLHNATKRFTFEHVLDKLTNKKDQLFGIIKNRFVKYSLATATQDIDTKLGDQVLIKSPAVLGGGGEVSATVITADQSADTTTLEASDLLGL